MYENKRMPNLFWPILFIGLGALLLLNNFGIIEGVDFWSLLRLWPLIFVAVGFQVLFGRGRAWVGNLISAGIVLAALAFVIFAPSLGIESFSPSNTDFVTETFKVEDTEIETATVKIDLDSSRLTISPLADSPNFFEAEVHHNQILDFNPGKGSKRHILLTLEQDDFFAFGNWFNAQQVTTTIGLGRDVPFNLDVDLGSGAADLDLSGLDILALSVNTGSGSIDVILPTGSYKTTLDTGSGSIDIVVLPNTELNLVADTGSGRIVISLAEGVSGEVDLDSGSGSLTVEVADGVGVQISGRTGSGSVTLPSGWVRVSGRDDSGPSKSGTWRSPNFDEAETKVYITFDVGSGSLRVL